MATEQFSNKTMTTPNINIANSYNVYVNGKNIIMTVNGSEAWDAMNAACNTLVALGIKFTKEREEKTVSRMNHITINHNINIITK